MRVLGLTGGIGMGKSTAARFLREAAVPVVDTDELARLVVQPGQPALEEIRALFGPEMIGPHGELCRGKLADIIFSDAAARKRLENVVHPRISELWRSRVESWRREARPLAVVIIPLLFETGAEREFDGVICVACSATTQRRRLQARGWSGQHLEQRISAQLPIEEKIARADYVIWSEGSLNIHQKQLERVLKNFC